jgi:hypothetical protein
MALTELIAAWLTLADPTFMLTPLSPVIEKADGW